MNHDSAVENAPFRTLEQLFSMLCIDSMKQETKIIFQHHMRSYEISSVNYLGR